MGDDFDDFGFTITGIPNRIQFGLGDFAQVFIERIGKDNGGGGLGVFGRAGAVGFDFGARQPGLAANGAVRRQAVFAGIFLGDGEGDAFAGFRLKAAGFGNTVQT